MQVADSLTPGKLAAFRPSSRARGPVHFRYGSRVRPQALRRSDRSIPQLVGPLAFEQLQRKLLSAYKISRACPGVPSPLLLLFDQRRPVFTSMAMTLANSPGAIEGSETTKVDPFCLNFSLCWGAASNRAPVTFPFRSSRRKEPWGQSNRWI